MDRRHVVAARMDLLHAEEDLRERRFRTNLEWAWALGYQGKSAATAVWRLTNEGVGVGTLAGRLRLSLARYADPALALRLALWLCGEGSDGEMPQPLAAPAEARDPERPVVQSGPVDDIKGARERAEDLIVLAQGLAHEFQQAMRGGPKSLEAAAPLVYRQIVTIAERIRPLSHTNTRHFGCAI